MGKREDLLEDFVCEDTKESVYMKVKPDHESLGSIFICVGVRITATMGVFFSNYLYPIMFVMSVQIFQL